MNMDIAPPTMKFVDLEELQIAVQNYLDENNTIPYPDIRDWDVSEVDDMTELFKDLIDSDEKNDRIAGISDWDVSNVENMESMFEECSHFNQPLNEWDVSSVEDMSSMFRGCDSFDQPLDEWDVSNVKNMTSMFNGCSSFNQNLNGWVINTNLSDMNSVFKGCTSFNQPLDRWNVENVRIMMSMFEGCSTFNQYLGSWNVNNVSNMASMFQGCVSFDIPLNSWALRTKNLINLNRMFYNCPKFPRYSIQAWGCFEEPYDYNNNLIININDIFGPNDVNTPLGIFYTIQQYHNLIVPNNLPNQIVDNSILERTIYDPIMLEDVTVRDYLNENLNSPDDDKHIIFVKQDDNNPNNINVVGVTRNDLKRIIYNNDGSAVRYACLNVGESLHITPNMIKYFPLFANRFIGLHGGLTMLADLKYIITHPEITMVKLVENRRESPAVATASLNMLSTFANAVSAAHCQAGTGERIYNLVNISSVTNRTSGGKRKSHHTKKQKKSNKRKTKKVKRIKKHLIRKTKKRIVSR
jgi:surface protein